MVRGGESGRQVQEAAISYALKEDIRLSFLHIVDLNIVPAEDERLIQIWREELTWLAQISLGLARRRAEESGLHPETVILYGPIFTTAVDYIRKHQVTRVFIGSPHSSADDYDKRMAGSEKFAEDIHHHSGVEVTIIGAG
jgi:nucleotide-binding universal stress UspA family protein